MGHAPNYQHHSGGEGGGGRGGGGGVEVEGWDMSQNTSATVGGIKARGEGGAFLTVLYTVDMD